MSLNIDFKEMTGLNVFAHSDEFDQGQGRIRKGAEGILVAQDGSGDFSNIQTALNAVPTGGGKITIKEGTYYTEVPFVIKTSGTQIEGVSKNTIIRQTKGEVLFQSTGLDNIRIANMTIRGTHGSGQVGMTFVGGDQIIIDNVKVYYFGEEGILMESVTNSWIKDCFIDNNEEGGVHLTSCEHIIISQCRIRCYSFEGIIIAACLAVEISNNVVDGLSPIFGGGGDGIRVRSTSIAVNIIGNIIFYCWGEGIQVDGNSAEGVINGNIIHRARNTGILISAGSVDWIVTNNLVHDCAFTDAGTGTQIAHNRVT